MSDFPEIEPFGPRPTPRHDAGEGSSSEPIVETKEPVLVPSQSPNYALSVVTAFGVGIVVGYLLFRNQEIILRQTKLDDFLDSANAWVREQSPRITDPIKQGIESTGSTFNEAIKSTGSNIDDIIKRVKSGLKF
jgi:hypothetical protein